MCKKEQRMYKKIVQIINVQRTVGNELQDMKVQNNNSTIRHIASVVKEGITIWIWIAIRKLLARIRPSKTRSKCPSNCIFQTIKVQLQNGP